MVSKSQSTYISSRFRDLDSWNMGIEHTLAAAGMVMVACASKR